MLLIRSVLFVAFGGISVAVGALLVLLTFWAPSRVHWAITVGYCRLAVWAGRFFCGMDPVVEGLENMPDEPSVIMIKHTTTLETYGHVPMFPRTAWVLKREIIWMPIFGWVIGLLLVVIGGLRRWAWVRNPGFRLAHLAAIVEMTRDPDRPALVLLDEVGAGTDPTEGGALGVAIVEHFRQRGAMVLATTHHGLMKAYAQSTAGVSCAAFGYDPETWEPTFRLTLGAPGRSLALEMAERLDAGRIGGPSEDIIKGSPRRWRCSST